MGRKKEGLVPLPFRALVEAQGVVFFGVFFSGAKFVPFGMMLGKVQV